MRINIHNPIINFHGAPAMANALIASLFSGDGAEAVPQAAAPADRPAIGEYWPGQGGFFSGDFRGDDGSIFGLIRAEDDIGTKSWGPSGELSGMTTWDGKENTRILLANGNYPAAKACSEYTRDGHSDFYLPSQRELQLASANIRHLFKKAYHWSSTPHSKDYAWVVGFENGSTNTFYRFYEFRAAPFRRLIY